MDFLWHKVSEKEKEEIKEQAKQIIESFSSKLSKINKKIKEPFIERKDYEREEGAERVSDFSRELMFENASSKNKDFIVAEKKKW
jgi:Asp-tRNA(Asn)/Glu-tRNA(Gln) amidotransferase C subunit